MSDLLNLTAINGVDADVVKIELVYNGGQYMILCKCRVKVLGSSLDDVVIRVPINKDLKLHVDMFTAAVLSALKEGNDGT